MKCFFCDGKGMLKIHETLLPIGAVYGFCRCLQCNGTGKIMVKQYFYCDLNCKADLSTDPNCTCWHDEGTGPIPQASSNDEKYTWRDKPKTNSDPNLSGQDAYSQILVLRLRYEELISELTPATLKQCPVAIYYALKEFLTELTEAERNLIPK